MLGVAGSKRAEVGAENAGGEENSRNWFVGGVTDEQARTYDLSFNFLTPGVKYLATVYRDAPDANGLTNPEKYIIEQTEVTSSSTLPVYMAPAGGFAISLTPLAE